MRRTAARLLAALTAMALAACGGAADGADGADARATDLATASASGSAPEGGRAGAVDAVVDEVVVPAHAAFAAASAGLRDDVAALCGGPSEDALEAARAAWTATIDARSALEPVAVGPAADRASTSVIDWPVDVEAVGELLDTGDPINADVLASGPAGRRGLLAVEVLLFDDASAGLAAGDPQRCDYGAAATTAVAVEAERLVGELEGAGSDPSYADRLRGDGAVSVSTGGALDELVNAQVMTLEDLADVRLPSDGAGPASDRAAASSKAALATLEELYAADRLGTELPDEVHRRLLDDLAAAREATAALGAEHGEDGAGARERAATAVDAVRVGVRTDVVSALDVVLGFGDNDGDSG